jgi:mitosis inhibitor protein kinase SWE1
MCSPTPLSRTAPTVLALQSPALERAKSNVLSPVTPHAEKGISPHTPLDGFFPPDPSGLSISGRAERPVTRHGTSAIVPATPTGPRDYFANFSNRPSLNLNDTTEVDSSLSARFEKVELIGTGEFSQVYKVSVPPEASPFRKVYSVSTPDGLSRSSTGMTEERVFAVKKARFPFTGLKDRQRKLKEVEILKALKHADHVVSFIDSWEDHNPGYLYIQTEFCEEGTLDVFLAQAGLKARLDDFRIWKILLELSHGLKHIHDAGYMHLDMKPANILITFDGVLKIADFGMATKWPAVPGTEGEGDREYIGPEILSGKYDKPADIFALGLIMLEIAGNVELPDNGASWQKLRSGDMSDVPSLTWSSGVSSILRDSSGNPLPDSDESTSPVDHDMDSDGAEDENKSARSGELINPPDFMTNAANPQALDAVVKWMIAPTPEYRPRAEEILLTEGVLFVEARRRAGATVFEGNWGPADEVLAEDAEMIDV